MEKRIGNVIIQTPGGTASKNSSTYKVSLPSAWIKEMGITDSDRQIELSFDGSSITISKKLSLDEFISFGRDEWHVKQFLPVKTAIEYVNNAYLKEFPQIRVIS